MIHTTTPAGFRLSPAYDVVPNLWQQEHILSVANKTKAINYNDLLQEGNSFTLSRQRCRKMIIEAAQGVTQALEDNNDTMLSLSNAHPLCKRLLDTIRKNLNQINASIDKKQP
jgi:hypothetical protein